MLSIVPNPQISTLFTQSADEPHPPTIDNRHHPRCAISGINPVGHHRRRIARADGSRRVVFVSARGSRKTRNIVATAAIGSLSRARVPNVGIHIVSPNQRFDDCTKNKKILDIASAIVI